MMYILVYYLFYQTEYTDTQLDLLVSGLISLYNTADPEVLTAVLDTLGMLVKQLDPATYYMELVLVLKRACRALANDTRDAGIPEGEARGLCMPKGWQPLLAILREGLLAGGVEIKEVFEGNY